MKPTIDPERDPKAIAPESLARAPLRNGKVPPTTRPRASAISMRVVGCVAAATLLAGCASIVEGTDQQISIQSKPSKAACELMRDGTQLAYVSATPEVVKVDKSQHDIVVTCSKDGWDDGVGILTADFESMSFGNILIGGVIGAAVDAGSGAMHHYPPSIMVVLPRAE